MKRNVKNQTHFKRKIISYILVFVMLFSVLGAYVVPAENYYAAKTGYYVTGDFGALSGCNIKKVDGEWWQPGDDSGKMEHLRDNYYKKVVTFDEVTNVNGATVTFKVSLGSTWDDGEIGGGAGQNGNHIVKIEAGVSEFTVIVDANAKVIYNSIQDPDEVNGILNGSNVTPDLTPDSYLFVEYVGDNYQGKNIYVWNNGSGVEKIFVPFEECADGTHVAKVPVKFANGESSKTFGFLVLEGEDWNKKESGDLSYTINEGQSYAKVRFNNGKIVKDLTNIKSGVIKNSSKITFNYRDNNAMVNNAIAYLGESSEVSVVMMTETNGVKSASSEHSMTYNASEQVYTCSVNIEDGANCYYYYKVNGEKVEDFNSSNKQTVDGVEYSYVENNASGVSITADVYYDSMDYNDNNVISVDYKSNTEKELIVEHIYADFSELGQGSKVEINKDLKEFTFGCSYDITPGVKTITVTVVDKYGTEYEADVTVNVTKREKGDDFDWDEAVIYFAVTDRFFDGNASNNRVTESGKEYDKNNGSAIHGGDLAGLTSKLDELKTLGINTIWITPIVDNFDGSVQGDYNGGKVDTYGYHGYWAEDFTKLNPHLGTEAELKALIDAAHARGIKIMVDVVLNHSGYGGEKLFDKMIQKEDGYKPMIRTESIESDEEKYSLNGLPDFLTEDPEVRALLIEWQTAWMERFDIDYYRVDTVKHVEDATWTAFKNALTKIDPTFKMIGEYYDGGYKNDFNQLDNSMMDSILDFHFNDILIDGLSSENLLNVEKSLISRNGKLSNTATMGSFLSSHDEDGFIHILKNKGEEEDWVEALAKVAATYQATAKGQPVIYYGEELGQTGANNWPIQENRYDYDWAGLEVQKNQTNSMYNHYRKILNIRQKYLELFAKGNRFSVVTPDVKDEAGNFVAQGYEVFARNYNGTTIYVGTNVWGKAAKVTFYVYGEPGSVYKDLYNNKTYTVSNDGTINVSIPGATAGGTAILALESGKVQDVKNTNEVTVKIHYARTDANYTDWNVWSWVDGVMGSQYDLADENGEKVATIKVNGDINKVNFHIRKGEINQTGKHSIDISNVLSGTVHFYVKQDEQGGIMKLGSDVITKGTTLSAKTEPVVEVTSITLDKTATSLKKGETFALTATVAPDNATDKTVTWTTSDAKVATVNNGVVTAVADGTATITAKAGNKTATCTITVKTPAPAPTTVDVTSITLDKTTAALKKGETVTLKATVNPTNATNKTVTWTSDNTKVATVDANGTVKAVANGTATIIAKAGSKTATCKVTVTTDVASVILNKSTANVGVGKTITLKATVTPSDASDKKVTWKSSNTKVATVDKNGKVKGIKAGTATITVKTANGKKATCKVTVEKVKVTLNATSVPVQVKKTVTLKATSNLDSDKVKSWQSSNKKIATVSSKGVVKGVKAGKATITVTMKSGAKATCKVTVQTKKVTTKKLTIDQKKVTLKVGKSVTLKVTRNPISATEKITWTTTNKKIATVDKNGKVSAKKAGTVTITAKTSNGKKVTCKVTVKKK